MQRDKIYLADFKNDTEDLIRRFLNDTGEQYATKDDLQMRWDRQYHDPEFLKIEKDLKAKEIRTIGELADAFLGYSPKPQERIDEGEYLIIGGRNLRDGALIRTDKDKYINGERFK